MSKTFVGNVKSVLSGDTLILTSPNNPTAERTFALAYVTAPHLKREGDEPFAFQSREFLRNIVVGKAVQCTVLYTIPGSGREFGTAKLKDGTDLPDELVKAGWLKVREEAGRKDDSEEVAEKLENLRQLEAKAKAENKGLWATSGGFIEVQNDLGGPDFLNKWKGKTVDGVVERVLSGDRLLVRLLLSDKKHVQPMTLLAGIRTPSTERTLPSTGAVQPAEEHGNEAKQFVESRLLQRLVKVEIVGASAQGQLVANVMHPRGNIAVFLLQDGLARCNDFHSTMLGEKMAPLRAAEKEAQGKKLRIHKHHVAKADGGSQDMTVSKVIGADTIMVRSSKNATAEKRISLSSVRGPRTGEPSEAPFRDEAKEFLRQKLIGKQVKISVDGMKPANDGFEAKEMATVTEKGKNINLMLVEAGWASVIRHRKDDTDRASNYDELLAAQEKTKEEKKGMWSGKPGKAKQYTDLSENAQKAKIMLATLQRQKKVPAIVDFCKAGSRFTILVPRENVKLTMVLGGIRAPRAPRADGTNGEPFGKEAVDLANRRCNQRDCEVDIHDMDKVGGFIGALYINRENFAKVLVDEGLASVHAFSAEKSGNSVELFAAEKRAKEGKKGLWHDYDPSQEETYDEEPAEAAQESEVSLEKKPTDYRDVMITNIDNNGKIKIQEIGKGTAALETLMNEFRKFHLDSKNSKTLSDAPKVGEFVSSKFSADGQWYRGRVRANDRTAKMAEVMYVDYGNSEKVAWSALRPLEPAQFGTQKLKPQAFDASLSFVQLPTATNYFEESIGCIAELTEGKRLVGSFDFVDSKENVNYVTLYDPKSDNELPGQNDSINKEVVASGYGMVPKKLKAWERSKAFEGYLKHLREIEGQAKQDRLGMWEYGDITED